MKKRFAMMLIFILLIVASLFALTACTEPDDPPCSHQWSAATCTTAKICTLCNETEGTALGHSFGHWEQTLAPTCTGNGTERRDCVNCEAFETQSIPALQHNNVNWECSNCGESLGDWEIRYYVDEFNRPTNEKYITNKTIIFFLFNKTMKKSPTFSSRTGPPKFLGE